MNKILILDDDHVRHQQFANKYATEDLTQVHTSVEAIAKLKEHKFDYVFLDHDLGGEQMVDSGPGTGYEVAEWIANNEDSHPKKCVILHSLNPPGRKNMCTVLKSKGVRVMERPFLWMKDKN